MKKILSEIGNFTEKRERILAAVLFAVVSIFVILVTVGLNAGWHLVDDHELLAHAWQYRWGGFSIREIVTQNLAYDVALGRWRPLYRLFRALEAVIIGERLWIFYLWEMLRIFLVFFFLYLTSRKLGAGIIASLFHPFVVLCGYQAAAWWKLGPQEMFCMLLLSSSMFLLLSYAGSGKKVPAVLGIFLILCMSLYKEAFVLTIPFVALLTLYYDLKDEEKIGFSFVFICIRKRFLLYLSLIAITIGNLLVIVLYIGTENMGKADYSMIEPFIESVTHDLKWYALFGTVLFFLTLTFGKKCKSLWMELLLCLSLILPQYVLYAKRTIEERYLLPLSLGFSLFFVVFLPLRIRIRGLRLAIYVSALTLLLLAHGRVTLREGEYYRYRGQSVTSMLNIVREMTREDPSIRVLSCLYPNLEGDRTIADYNLVEGYDNVWYYTEDDNGKIYKVVDPDTAREDRTEEYLVAPEEMDIIVKYNELDRHWCYNPTFDKSGFRKIKCGTLDIFVREDLEIPVPEIRIRDTLFHFDFVTTVDPEEWN